MAKSIFQISPLDAETNSQLAAADDVTVSSPGLPDLPPISALPPLPSPRNTSSGDGRRPSTDAKPSAAIMTAFEKAAVRYDVPINVLMALGEQESRYDPMAIGTPTQWGRAKGLMQYLDSTASRMGINPFDPIQSIDAAARQLRDRLKKGYSMADAVKEHFAGPDRSKWGTKTARYGEEVLGRAARLKGELSSQYQQPGPWYSPGATPTSDNRPVPADAVTALVGEAKPMARPRIADTFEDPNSLPAIVARYESEAQRKPDEGSISTPTRPEGTFVNALKGAATASGEAFRQVGQGIRMQFEDAAGGAIDAMVDKVMPDAPGLGLEEQRRAFGRTNTEADFERSQARADAATPQFDSWLADAAYGGLQSLIQTTPGVAAGVAFGPATGLAILGGQTEAGAYGKYRARGATPGMALLGGVGEGAVEAGTEMLPMGWLADRFGSTGLKQFLSGYLLREMPTEQAATFLQDAIDTAIANPDKKWGDFWSERLDAAGKTAVATLMQSGAFAGANAALSRMAREDAAQAREELAADPAINAEAVAAMSPGWAAGEVMPAPRPDPAAVEPAVPVAAPATEVLPPPPPPAPSGPLGRALARAPITPIASSHVPAPIAEGAAPAAMELHAPGIRMPVQILGETPDAIWARTESGEELQIPRADLDAGDVQLVDPQALSVEQSAATAPANPVPPPANGIEVSAVTGSQNAIGASPAVKEDLTAPSSEAAPTVSEQEIVAPATPAPPAPAANSIHDLQEGMKGIASGMSDALVDMYHQQAAAGAVKDKAGATSPILQVAKKVRERRGGEELARADVEAIARAVDDVASTGQERQAALRGIVDQFAPETVDPVTGEVTSASQAPVAPIATPEGTAAPEGPSEKDLRARLKYLSNQARTNAGWTKPLLAERKKVEAAIDAINEARASAIPPADTAATAVPEQAPAVEAPAIAQASAEAATSPLNDLPEPTEAQKAAGNYRKGHLAIDGLNVSIENPAGTSRRPEWPPLKHSYGYVKRSEGADGDHVDVFLGPDAADTTKPVFIVDQVNEDGTFDEHKVMVGFADEQSARDGYLANYAPGWQGLGGVKEMPFADFKEWVRDPAKTKAPAAIDAPIPARDEATEQTGTLPVDAVEPLADMTPPPASSPAALPSQPDGSDKIDFGDMSAPDQQAAALRSAVDGQARSLPPSAKDWLISNRFAAERGIKGNVVVTMRGERELERLQTNASAQPVREPMGQTLSGNREQEAFGYSARDVAPMSPNLKAAVERADTRPEDQRRILDAIDRALIPDGDMLEMGSPRWALERGYADIGPTPTGRRGRLTEAGRAKLTELGGSYTAAAAPQSVVRPVDKKNPNPFARKGEKFTFSEQVDYIGGNPADTYTVESVGKKEAWFVNDRTGGRSSLPNFQMQKALRSGVMNAATMPVQAPTAKPIEYASHLAGVEAVAERAAVDALNGTIPKAEAAREIGRLVREEGLSQGVATVQANRLDLPVSELMAAGAIPAQRMPGEKTDGAAAARAGQSRTPPEDLSKRGREAWLRDYDMEKATDQRNLVDEAEPSAALSAETSRKSRTRRYKELRPEEERAIWADKRFKAAAKAMGAPHRESPVAAEMMRGWRDGQDPRPAHLTDHLKSIRSSIEDVQTSPTEGQGGFNPVDPYLQGYYAAATGTHREIRMVQAEEAIGSMEAIAQLRKRSGPDGEAQSVSEAKSPSNASASDKGAPEPRQGAEAAGRDELDLFSEGSEPIMAGKAFTSPDGLKTALMSSPYSAAIQRWMDAGRIVLHQSSDTLPIGASRASIRAFLDGDPVVTLTGDEFAPDGRPLTAKVTRWYREHGEEIVDTPGIGEVLLDAKAVKNSASHGLGRNKSAAFAAIPDVLRHGKIVHQAPLEGAYDGGTAYFVAAPIRMGDQDMIEIVMIRSDINAKRMYVHEVALRDVLRQPAFKTSAYAAETGMRSGAGAGALRTILQNIYAAKPEDDASLASEARNVVQGLTTPDARIHLVADQLTEATALPVLLHEMFHAGVQPLLGDAQWSSLLRRLETLYRGAAARLASGEREMSPFWTAALDRVDQARPPSAYVGEEFGAYAIEERATLPAGLGTVVDRLLGAFKAWLLRRFGRQVGQVTPDQLQSLAVAALRSQPYVTQNEAGDVRYSRRGPTVEEIDAATPGWVRNKITDAMNGDYNVLGTIPHDVLASEWARDHHLVAIRDYLRLKRRMDSTRDKWHAKAADVAKAWYIFQKASGNNVNQEMMDLMHEATLAGVDPARPFTSILTKIDRDALAAGPDSPGFEEARERSQADAQRKADHEKLTKAWDALPEKAKKIYVDVRDTYRDMSNAFEQALLDNLSKALDIRHRQVKETYDSELIRIADSDLSEQAKQAAFDEAEKVYNRESRVQRYAKGARMTRLRAFFETRNIAGPYFPLARFGSYFASARDKQSGDIVGFSRFETERAQQAFVAQMKKDGYAVEHGVLGAGGGLRDQVDPQFVVDVETILEGADISDAVRDAVWQRWLETLPDMSLRKSRIHRKGLSGFPCAAGRLIIRPPWL